VAGHDHQPDGQGHREQPDQEPAGHLLAPAVSPAGDSDGDPVDQVVKIRGRQLVGSRPQVDHVAVMQAQGADAQLLPQRRVAEPLQDPAAMLQAGIGQAVTQMPDERGQQVNERDMHRHSELDTTGRPADGQPAQVVEQRGRPPGVGSSLRAGHGRAGLRQQLAVRQGGMSVELAVIGRLRRVLAHDSHTRQATAALHLLLAGGHAEVATLTPRRCPVRIAVVPAHRIAAAAREHGPQKGSPG
jgi:hypothetical protein